jgi:hypothetical protein
MKTAGSWSGAVRQRAEQALDLARQYQLRGHQAWALWLLSESMARRASPEGELAVAHYRQALALAEALGMRPLQAHCQRGVLHELIADVHGSPIGKAIDA